MCRSSDDCDWYVTWQKMATTTAVERCSGCPALIPAGTLTFHYGGIEGLEDPESDQMQCRFCWGEGAQPVADDYGNAFEIPFGLTPMGRIRHPFDAWFVDEWGDVMDERPCAWHLCDDGQEPIDEGTPGVTVHDLWFCPNCEQGRRWLDHHCRGEYVFGDITSQVAEHSEELEWPSYADRAIIAAANRDWQHYEAHTLRRLVDVAIGAQS